MARLVNVIIGIIEALFLVRLGLQLFVANTSSQFVAWIYGATNALAGPFAGAFPPVSLGNGSVIDFSIVLAMIGYGILGWLIILLLSFVFPEVRRI